MICCSPPKTRKTGGINNYFKLAPKKEEAKNAAGCLEQHGVELIAIQVSAVEHKCWMCSQVIVASNGYRCTVYVDGYFCKACYQLHYEVRMQDVDGESMVGGDIDDDSIKCHRKRMSKQGRKDKSRHGVHKQVSCKCDYSTIKKDVLKHIDRKQKNSDRQQHCIV
jgi:hypothetical protein